jgi:NTP pyrophosphatase (non-canonical NTP hydrolase)
MWTSLELDVIRWAEARGIIPNAEASTQLMKTVSELGELCDAEIKDDILAIRDGVGDVLITLIIYCAIKDISIVDCLQDAYAEIKDRKGFLNFNGVFVKDE